MSKNQNNVAEDRLAGANYIFNFYNNVNQLTHQFSLYLNITTQLKEKHSNDATTLQDQEKQLLSQTVESFRYYIYQTYIQLKSIAESTETTDDNTNAIEEIYKQIKNTFFIDSSNADKYEKYVQKVNEFLMSKVIKKLLQTSEHMVNDFYS